MRNKHSGFSLLEAVLVVVVLAIMATLFVPLASGLVDAKRATSETDELQAIYKAIVGEPKLNTFGYLGDVGDYPASLQDLINPPAAPNGWNGPYIFDARMQNSILYDQFGGEIEYYRPLAPSVPAFPVDQIALISKGPDRGSDNTGGNMSASFNGTIPSGGYAAAAISNKDNIVYPKFTDNTGVLNYQSLGRVAFNILNYDENAAVNAFVPGCPELYDIVVTSVPRASNEAYLNYAPGGAVVDLLQGLYTVTVSIAGGPGATAPVWKEQISVQPSSSTNRDLHLPGIKSDATFGTVSLVVANNSGATIRLMEYSTTVGATYANGATSPAVAVHRCSRIFIVNNTTNVLLDSFIMPNGNYNRRVQVPPDLDTLVVTNDGPNETVSVYDEGVLAGTVSMRGNRRVKVFSLKDGDSITVRNENNGLVETFLLLSSPTTKNY